MKLAFNTLGCPDWSVERVVSAAAALGYDGVEVCRLHGRRSFEEMPELGVDLARTRRLFSDAGVAVCCLSVGVILSMRNRSERRLQIRRAHRAIEVAAALRCPCVRVFGGQIPSGVPRADSADDIAQALTALGGSADPLGVMVLLETHDGFCRGEHAADVLARVSGPGVGSLWDILHSYRCGEAIADTINFLGESIRHVHVKDGVNLSPCGFQPVLPGEGDVPVRDAVRLLRQIGYDGYLSLEWEKAWHPEIPDPEVAFPQFIGKMREILSEA
ncbi:MAG: sugar phosphate isomerase/epimerase [Armatimonadetes bacterium]|nr:sugar phosphate isomerase/epimerase [Armatimonadota bacterium]